MNRVAKTLHSISRIQARVFSRFYFFSIILLFPFLLSCEKTYSLRRLEAQGPHPVQFADVSDQSGIQFVHNWGADGKKYMPETTGSGCAFLDYDNDGWQDILLVNSMNWPGRKHQTSISALYRNNHDGTFIDVTRDAGLDMQVYGMGVCVGDYDNDGYLDLYMTCLGPNILFRNHGDGTFVQVTKTARVEGDTVDGSLRWKWSSSCAWVDYDQDGWLDLFVCNYVKWSPQRDVWCGRANGPKAYCPPDSYEGVPNTLYHNNQDGTFTNVTKAMGISQHIGKAWGVAVCDFNGDGWLDIAIANDSSPNFLFTNQRGKKFIEEAVESGIAVNETGQPRAGMGIDVASWRNDGHFGILIGNFTSEGLGLYENDSSGSFNDVAHSAGLGDVTLTFLTFGLLFLDYDNDGWEDALTANGHIDDLIHYYESRITYEQRPQVFHNQHNGTFREVGMKMGGPLRKRYVLRGCASGDYDNDGDLDVLVVANNNKRARLWRNDGGNQNHWLRLATIGKRSNRDGIGTLIRLSAGGTNQWRYVKSGSSFLSQNDLRVLFGLGSSSRADEIQVRWPDGKVEVFHNLTPNSTHILVEGGERR